MPCDTIQYTTLDLGKLDTTLLADSLKNLGFTIIRKSDKLVKFEDRFGREGRFEDGRLRMEDRMDLDSSQVMRAYSARFVEAKAKKAGWNVKRTEKGVKLIKRK